ncbi:hypothetical protein C8J56DRAFT_950283, partial [Mycena floridula]
MNNIGALTSPIQGLPPEVLTIIFGWCLRPNPSDYGESEFHYLNDFTAPEELQISILSAVCSVWRNIAIATPRFWSKIAVNMGDIGHWISTEATLRLVDLHATRSQGHPLTLRLHNAHSFFKDDGHETCEMGDCIYENDDECNPEETRNLRSLASRLSTLVVHPDESCRFIYMNIAEDLALPALKILEIRLHRNHDTFQQYTEFPKY